PIVMGDMRSTAETDPRLIKEFRASVQISNYDADTFERHARKLFDYLNTHSLSSYEIASLKHLLERVEAHCYPRLGSGVTIWLGTLYYRLGDYQRCFSVLEKSLLRFGPNFHAYYYIAACYQVHFKQPDKALDYYYQALKCQPEE